MRAVAFALLLLPQEGLEERRDRLSGRLEEIRGIRYKEKLRVRAGSRNDYARLSLETAKSIYGENLVAAEQFLKAMGFIPHKMRLDLAITANAAMGVDAYCAGGELVVLNPKVPDDQMLNRMALGLLDQHHPEADLRRKAGPTIDAQMAVTALRAGDADVCKVLFWFTKKGDEKISDDWIPGLVRQAERWEREDSRFRSAVFPRLFVRSSDFGYRRGGIFVETIRTKAGMKAVDSAYDKLPASTEQILHPEKYLAGEAPVALDLAPLEEKLAEDGYGITYRTTLGEFGSAVFLETHVRDVEPSAAEGWGGDRIVLFEGRGMWFIVWATEWDSEKDAEEFQAALGRASQKLMPGEKGRSNLVVRKKTATVWLFNIPEGARDGILESVWKCRKDGKAAYGE